MSTAALLWARDVKLGSPSRKLVLLALADRANEELAETPHEMATFIGQQKLADECELSRRTVIRVLAGFEEAGLIRREKRHRADGTRTSDMLYLNTAWRPPGQRPSDTVSRDRERADHVTLDARPSDTVSQQKQKVKRKGKRKSSADPAASQRSAGADPAPSSPEPEPEPGPDDGHGQQSFLPSDAQPVDKRGGKGKAGPWWESARRIVAPWWERQTPRPSVPFVAIVKILERALEGGHKPADLARFLEEAPVVTGRALDFWWSQQQAGGGRVENVSQWDRSAPGGRVDVAELARQEGW